MLLSRHNGWQNGILRCVLMDNTSSTGGALIGLTNASSGLLISTIADVEATPTVYSAAGTTVDTIAALGTYVAPASGHCRLQQVDSTNHPGLYELQFLNTRFAVTGASYLIVTISAAGAHCSPQSFLIDLDAQVDVYSYAGGTGTATGGVPTVNVGQIQGQAARATKLASEMDQRVTGTVSGTYSNTSSVFECTDITDARSYSAFQNRAFQVTGGTQIGEIGVILADQVGTSGRRFTCPALPGGALAAGDTILIY